MAQPANLLTVLRNEEGALVAQAARTLRVIDGGRYRGAAEDRLRQLHGAVLAAVAQQRADPLRAHMDRVARERRAQGLALGEVLAAFNCMEHALWERLAASLPPEAFRQQLHLLNGLLKQGKDQLIDVYVGR